MILNLEENQVLKIVWMDDGQYVRVLDPNPYWDEENDAPFPCEGRDDYEAAGSPIPIHEIENFAALESRRIFY
jgi:hypothetical protein